ncbi:hypothetical protein S40285_02924 [Stachybotrys chlorohalonatus IBT 40285]|uniref:Geranylgeranyl transferase type-2 subunit alpha n=1 Tax=Stachybotrys chlorohalonatus (strain IBT 40285) TaxID=1283841 RepID=A0A084QK59_STAC4|nr:hypothetical protein S40285_02924 [Stachybotrys chlorohalonata IBT 40285]
MMQEAPLHRVHHQANARGPPRPAWRSSHQAHPNRAATPAGPRQDPEVPVPGGPVSQESLFVPGFTPLPAVRMNPRSDKKQICQVADSQFDGETFALTSKLLRLNPEYYTVWNARRRCLTSGSSSRPSPGSWPSTALPNSSASATRTTSSVASSPSSSTGTPRGPEPPTAGRSGTTHDSQEDLEALLRDELLFTVPLLMKYPKCYWLWNYRLWTLGQAVEKLPVAHARAVWQEELGLVGKMLHKDRRNFHAWGYRRHVVATLESPALEGHSLVEAEFEYTTKMINMDLSNFSAWHNRSQLIPRLLKERSADDAARKKFLEAELTQIRNALNVGPEDQSLWFYHQYLMLNLVEQPERLAIAPGLTQKEREAYVLQEIEDIKELLEDYTNIKWIYEALVDYTVAVIRITPREWESQELQDITTWLQELKTLDPSRGGRWKDLEADLGIGSSS